MRWLMLLLIRFYRNFISPLKPPCCRYYPTCSLYALQAVNRFGALKGGFLAVRRILRCNPWSPGGFDYVPEQFSLHMLKKNKKPIGKYCVNEDEHKKKGTNNQ